MSGIVSFVGNFEWFHVSPRLALAKVNCHRARLVDLVRQEIEPTRLFSWRWPRSTVVAGAAA